LAASQVKIRLSSKTFRQFHRVNTIIIGIAHYIETRSNHPTQSNAHDPSHFGSSSIGRGHLDNTNLAANASVYITEIASQGIAQTVETHLSMRTLSEINSSLTD